MKLRADAVEAERRLAVVGASLMDAVSFYLAHAKPAGGARTVQQLIAEERIAPQLCLLPFQTSRQRAADGGDARTSRKHADHQIN
jgi:hypothetical protein